MAKTENAAAEKSPEIAADLHGARCRPFGRGGRSQSGRIAVSSRLVLIVIFPCRVLVGAVPAAWAGYLLGAALLAATPTLAGWIAAIAAFLAVFVCAARWLHFLLVMDDWAFARDLARGAGADHDWRV